MHLLPECLNAVKYRGKTCCADVFLIFYIITYHLWYVAFWESIDDPSLKKFLDFRLSAGDLEEMKVEYTRYNNDLNTISRFYAEASDFGQKVLKWKSAFKASYLYYLLDEGHEYTNYHANRRVCSGNDCNVCWWICSTNRLETPCPLSTLTTLQTVVFVVGTTVMSVGELCLVDIESHGARGRIFIEWYNLGACLFVMFLILVCIRIGQITKSVRDKCLEFLFCYHLG